jgi:hypothetical protein
MTMTTEFHFKKTMCVLAVICAALAVEGCKGRAVIPSSYKTFNADDGSFAIEYPAEWEVESGGKSGYAWAKFSSGAAEITVDCSAVGSIIADLSKTARPMLGIQPTEDTASVTAVHEFEREGFEEDQGVKEKTPEPVATGMTDARKAEFEGKTTFGGSIHGYRTTALSSTQRIRVVCKCPESQWEGLKPAFDKIIPTLKRGK